MANRNTADPGTGDGTTSTIGNVFTFLRISGREFVRKVNQGTLSFSDLTGVIRVRALLTTVLGGYVLWLTSATSGLIQAVFAAPSIALDRLTAFANDVIRLLASIPVALFGPQFEPGVDDVLPVSGPLTDPGPTVGAAFQPLLDAAEQEPLFAFIVVVVGTGATMFVVTKLASAFMEAV